MISKFRKKPVVIEAVQLKSTNWDEVATFVYGINLPYINHDYIRGKEVSLEIKTLEGVMTASLNDWIIKGVSGEFYPCKPDIFEKTYEKVE